MTKNTNYLVYVHIKKKQLEQNCCQTSRMTKNTNDLVIIYLHLAEIKTLNLQLLKKKITK